MTSPADAHEQSLPRPAARPPAPGEQAERPETFGPLAVTRHVKDDGRALILYTLRAQPDASGERGA